MFPFPRGTPFMLLLIVLLLVLPDHAHDVITTKLTYSRDISRIFLKRCAACHAASASMPLTSYQEVRPWAVDIKEQVLSRQMPPWGAVKGFGNLLPDGALSQEEIMIIAAWVVGGAPEGDPKLLPKESSVSLPSKLPRMQDGPIVETQLRLSRSLPIIGIRPLSGAPIETARLTAQLPSGEIVPLVWLYRFDSKSQQVFTFRDSLLAPAGTVIESSTPLRFALLLRDSRKTGAVSSARAKGKCAVSAASRRASAPFALLERAN
jgi:hypothetical protein